MPAPVSLGPQGGGTSSPVWLPIQSASSVNLQILHESSGVLRMVQLVNCVFCSTPLSSVARNVHLGKALRLEFFHEMFLAELHGGAARSVAHMGIIHRWALIRYQTLMVLALPVDEEGSSRLW